MKHKEIREVIYDPKSGKVFEENILCTEVLEEWHRVNMKEFVVKIARGVVMIVTETLN